MLEQGLFEVLIYLIHLANGFLPFASAGSARSAGPDAICTTFGLSTTYCGGLSIETALRDATLETLTRDLSSERIILLRVG